VAIAGPRLHVCGLFMSTMAALVVSLALGSAGAQASSRMDRVERAIVKKVNRIRAASGLHRLHGVRSLARSADYHCRDMLSANFFAHTSSNGQSMADRVESFRRAKRVGETLAYVSGRKMRAQAGRIVGMWMNSPPHRATLLDPGMRRIGVARRKGRLGSLRAIVFTADLTSKR
jgi:uncharacterized protein YkwD